MLARLVLLFTLVPILELAILIQVGSRIGLWPTLALVIGTGVLGAALTRREGLRAWRALQTELSEGRMPARSIMDGVSIFTGGALLLTPGLLTDAVGFALLARPSRRWLQDRVIRRLRRSILRVDAGVYMRSGTFGRGGRDRPRAGAGEGEEDPARGADRPKGRRIDADDESEP